MDAERTIRAHEKLLLIGEILTTYVRVRISLRRFDLVDAVARLRASAPATAGPAPSESAAQATGIRLGHIVQKTISPLPTDSRCLMQSLVLTTVLARRNIATSLIIGVRTNPDFGAHAWIEHDGKPLLPAFDVLDRRLAEV